MDTVELTVEALKLIQEWSRWLVGIDVAVVSGVFSFAFNRSSALEAANITIEKNNRQTYLSTRMIVMAGALLLLVSAMWASIILIGTAAVISQIAEYPGHRIFDYTIPFPFPGPLSIAMPLWIPLTMQNATFVLGLMVFLFYFGSILHDAPRNPRSDA